MTDYSKISRKRHKMPSFVNEALELAHLMDAYLARPAYQQKDYLGWINSAKMEETKNKRLKQMLEELKKGGIYMKMSHPASAKK